MVIITEEIKVIHIILTSEEIKLNSFTKLILNKCHMKIKEKTQFVVIIFKPEYERNNQINDKILKLIVIVHCIRKNTILKPNNNDGNEQINNKLSLLIPRTFLDVSPWISTSSLDYVKIPLDIYMVYSPILIF